MAIDDVTRLVYAEPLPDERRYTTAWLLIRAALVPGPGHQRRARPDRQRIRLSQPLFRRVLHRLGIARKRTRPYRPQTNGKVERWIRTVLSEWLYLEVFASSEQRRRAPERFVAFYNDRRPHVAFKGGRPPRRRLAQLRAAA